MMFFIKALAFVLCFAILCIFAIGLYWLIVFAMWLINGIKKLIVWACRDKVVRLTLLPAQKRYRREAVETGFSCSAHHRSLPVYHYRYVTVFDGTYRNVIVSFANNMKIKINIKEESLLYQKLLNM